MRSLQFILSLPVWIVLVPAFGWCMDHVCDAIENASDSLLYQLIVVPIAGVTASIIIPILFLFAGMIPWFAIGCLLGIEM